LAYRLGWKSSLRQAGDDPVRDDLEVKNGSASPGTEPFSSCLGGDGDIGDVLLAVLLYGMLRTQAASSSETGGLISRS
jgi:hypothetical protein